MTPRRTRSRSPTIQCMGWRAACGPPTCPKASRSRSRSAPGHTESTGTPSIPAHPSAATRTPESAARTGPRVSNTSPSKECPAADGLHRRVAGLGARQRGRRLSANAIAPSFASLEVNTGTRIFICSANIVSGLHPRDSVIIRLVATTASGPLAVIFSANAIAASRAVPARPKR